jgi:hypothetical protein
VRADALVAPHPSLAQLGEAPGRGYARWCGAGVGEEELAALRAATASELAFGSDAFRARIEAMTSRATFRGRPGPRSARAIAPPPEKLRL